MNTVLVNLDGRQINVVIEGGGLGPASSIAVAEAVAAAAAAEASAADAEAAAIEAAGVLSTAALKANNLSDLVSAPTALTNLGGTTVGKAVFTAVDAAAARTATGLVIGTDVQAYAANLTTWAGVTPGTGVAAALAVNVGSAGAPVLFDGAGGTPSSMTLTNATGLPVAGGGTGASTAPDARTNLGLVIGTDVQAFDADLSAIAALTSAADKMPYATGPQTWALADLTSFARTLLATASNSAFLTALGNIAGTFVNFLQAGTGAVLREMQARGRDRVSILDFIPVAEQAAILAGNGASTYDCTAALNAAIASVSVNGESFLLPGPEIWFPPGWYEFASTVEIDKTVSLVGGGCGMNGGQSTVLNWPTTNTGGLVFLWTNSPNTRTAAASKIIGLSLKGGGGTSGHGIWARCRVSLEDVAIGLFGGSGFFSDADTGGVGVLRGNSNLSSLNRVWSHDNAGWGVYLAGVDANAFTLTNVDMSTNTLGGYYDDSLLGNTLIGCHTATNSGPAYKTVRLTAATVLVGCYQEADQPASELVRPTVVLGGTMAPLMFSAGSQAPYLFGGEFGLETNRGIISKTLDGSGNIITSSIGAPTGSTNGVVQGFDHGAFATSFLRTRWFNTTNLTTNVRGLDGAQISAVTFEGTTVENGRGASDPFANIQENLVIGSGPNTFDGRHVAFGTAAPTTGAHASGEIVWNKNFSGAGSTISWHCYVAGTPGTWYALVAP